MLTKKITLAMVMAILVLASPPARSQAAAQNGISTPVLGFAGQIAALCLKKWNTPPCLRIISESNMVLLSNYGAALQNSGDKNEAEQIKQHCAATTAASQQTVPAYAMHSALTECANVIADIADKTRIQPNPSHYQLLIAPLLCLGADPRCGEIEEQMKIYERQ